MFGITESRLRRNIVAVIGCAAVPEQTFLASLSVIPRTCQPRRLVSVLASPFFKDRTELGARDPGASKYLEG